MTEYSDIWCSYFMFWFWSNKLARTIVGIGTGLAAAHTAVRVWHLSDARWTSRRGAESALSAVWVQIMTLECSLFYLQSHVSPKLLSPLFSSVGLANYYINVCTRINDGEKLFVSRLLYIFTCLGGFFDLVWEAVFYISAWFYFPSKLWCITNLRITILRL